MIAIILCSVIIGVAATRTVELLEDLSHRELLSGKAEIQTRLAESRLHLMQQHFQETKEKAEDGLISDFEVSQLAGEVTKMELEVQRRQFDLMEIERSSRSPQNELSAPLIDGRDFVTERLQLDLRAHQETKGQIQAAIDRLQVRIDAGLIHPRERVHLDLQLDEVQSAIDNITQKLDLRARFCRSEVTADEVIFEGMIAETEERLQSAELAVEHARAQLEALEQAFQRGQISRAEVEQARFQLQLAEADLKLAQMDRQTLQTKPAK